MPHTVGAADEAEIVIPQWQRAIGGYGMEKASAGLVLPDGTILIAGEMTADEDAVNSDGLMLALSPAGDLLWRRQYGDDGHDTTHGIVPAQDGKGGYFVIGDRTGPGEDAADELWMLRIGPKGELLWTRDLPDEENAYDRYIFNMPQAQDGGFFVVGQARLQSDRLQTRGFVMRFDAAGNVLWQRKYGSGTGDVLLNMRQLPGGDLLAIGRSNATKAGHTIGWVMRMDAGGEVLWERQFGNHIFQQLRSMAPVKDGFVVSGDAVPDDDGPQQAWILTIDSDGKTLDEQVFTSGYDQSCYDVRARKDGGYVVLCDLDHRDDADTDSVMLRVFSAEGQPTRSFLVSGAGNDTAFRLFTTPQDDIVVLGTTKSRPAEAGENPFTDVADDYDIWVFRVNGKKFTP